ncbi:unnamed protein product [Lathyrus sativus]|nr:unnamed protein product [Lathyrus sativus]
MKITLKMKKMKKFLKKWWSAAVGGEHRKKEITVDVGCYNRESGATETRMVQGRYGDRRSGRVGKRCVLE